MAVLRDKTAPRDIRRIDRDRKRHNEIVREAIKENLKEILDGIDIVSISPHQKIKIPLRSYKEFQFAFSEKTPGAAQAPGKGKGDKLGEEKDKSPDPGPQAGDMPGEDIYEVEMYAGELQDIIDEKYNLPNLEELDKSKTPDQEKTRTRGYKKKGPLPKLARRRTAKRRLERLKGEERIKKDLEKDKTS